MSTKTDDLANLKQPDVRRNRVLNEDVIVSSNSNGPDLFKLVGKMSKINAISQKP